MSMTRWNPLASGHDLTSLRDEFDRLFESAFDTRWSSRSDSPPSFVPAVDVEANAEAFVLRFDLTGVSQKDVKVRLVGDKLTIRGERKLQHEDRNGSTHRIERAHGAFERSFTLRTPVRNDQVAASYRDGVLEIRVPKA